MKMTGTSNSDRAMRHYLIGAVVVWVGLFAGTVVLLEGTGHLFEMLIIMAAGAFWFVVLAPQLFRQR